MMMSDDDDDDDDKDNSDYTYADEDVDNNTSPWMEEEDVITESLMRRLNEEGKSSLK